MLKYYFCKYLPEINVNIMARITVFIALAVIASLNSGAIAPTVVRSTEILATLGNRLRVPNYAPDLIQRIKDLTGNTTITAEVDTLAKAGNLQEIIWRLHDAGRLEAAVQLEKIISDRLATDDIIDLSKIEEGVEGARLVEFASGLRGVYKTGGSRELALYRLDQLIGTNVFPITTVRTIDSKQGSIQLFIENAPSANDIYKLRKASGDERNLLYSKEINSLRLLGSDVDRNTNNVLYPYRGRAIAIDGGRAFSESEIITHIDASNINWDALWQYLSKNRERTGDLQWSNISEGAGYITDNNFITGLEKITLSQVNFVVSPLLNLVDTEMWKIYEKLGRLKNLLGETRGPTSLELRYGSELTYHYIEKYGDNSRRLLSIISEMEDINSPRSSTYQRIKKYVGVVKETGTDVDKSSLSSAKLKQALFVQPKDLPVYKHEEQYRALIQREAWDELDTLLVYGRGITSIVSSAELRSLFREITSMQGKIAQPLSWTITAPDGSQHRLLAGNDDVSLSVFGEAGVNKIAEELAGAELLLHSGEGITEHKLVQFTRLLNSAEFTHLFNFEDMRDQLATLAKATHKKTVFVPQGYSYFDRWPLDELMHADQHKHDFYFNSAYVDGDLDTLADLATLYANPKIDDSNNTLLTKIKTHCAQGENCFVYIDIVDLLAGSASDNNFLKILQRAGYIVERRY